MVPTRPILLPAPEGKEAAGRCVEGLECANPSSSASCQLVWLQHPSYVITVYLGPVLGPSLSGKSALNVVICGPHSSGPPTSMSYEM